METLNFLDTSAVLNGGLSHFQNKCVSSFVLSELEKIKCGSRNSDVKFQAREAIREIITFGTIITTVPDIKRLKKKLKKFSFLEEKNDHYLIIEAYSMTSKYHVNFITSDSTQYLFARQFAPALNAILFNPKEAKNNSYCGWMNVYPDTEAMAAIYSTPSNNIFNCKTNEFIKIYEEEQLKDILFWDGNKYSNIKYQNIRNQYTGENVKPKNIEQKMAFSLLQNNNIGVKLLVGPPGVGKDYLMLLNALEKIRTGEKERIIFIRNLVPFKDAPEIGFLAGSLQEKIEWGLGPIASIIGEEGLNYEKEQGRIEAVNLGFIRGCQWDNSILYVSEGQNITGGGYKLLVSRCGKNSELWINGDVLQTDAKKFEENNGLSRLVDSLAGNPLFGMVELVQTERSAIADLASII